MSSQLGYLRVGEGPGVLQGDGNLNERLEPSEVLRGRNTAGWDGAEGEQ